MLLYPNGQPIPDTMPPPPKGGSVIGFEDSDRGYLSSTGRDLDPGKVDAIMRAADSGDTAQMCALSEAIDDRSFAIGAALDTRRAAIAATRWSLEPGDDTPRAEEIARAAEQMLRSTKPTNELLTFGQMVKLELGSALLPGFAAPEIVWSRGGTEVLGYNSVPQKHFTFVDSRVPLLVTAGHPSGVELAPGRFVVHWHRAKGGNATRGGLIRASAWMRSFETVNYKDLLRFVERYGMPFLVARVDEKSWKTERTVLRAIVRNFGPDGGAVLSKNAELDLLEAGRSDGEVYFRLLEYLREAAERLILGQTGTSGEGGWSNNGAQHMVRMDIRDSDCTQIEETIYGRILVPWTVWNYGPGAPPPRMTYDIEEAKDTQAEASVIKTLEEAGWEVDAEQIETSTGYRVKRKAQTQPAADAAALSGDDVQAFRRVLADLVHGRGKGLALGDGNGGMDGIDRLAASATPAARKATLAMFAALQDRLDEVAAIEDEAAFAEAARALSAELPELAGTGDGAELERIMADVMYGAAAAGVAERAEQLGRRKR